MVERKRAKKAKRKEKNKNFKYIIENKKQFKHYLNDKLNFQLDNNFNVFVDFYLFTFLNFVVLSQSESNLKLQAFFKSLFKFHQLLQHQHEIDNRSNLAKEKCGHSIILKFNI